MSYRWKILIAIGLALTVADQWTKYLAVKHLTPGIAQAKSGSSGPISAERMKTLNAEISHPAGLVYFYTQVRHPCQVRGPQCPTISVVDGFWNFRYVENPGAAWGLMATADKSFRVPFFLFVSLAAVVFIIMFFRRLSDDQHLMIWSLSFVFGGALGNLIDRLHLNYVVDFIDWYAGTYHWPTFNVADAGITTGVALLALEWLRDALRGNSSPAADSPQ
ncbi:MAG: signal peptidase II [Myxococcales bacterium]|nr:signal peptidase II [Myxococcales bacterium]